MVIVTTFSEVSVVMRHDSKANPMGPALIHPAKPYCPFRRQQALADIPFLLRFPVLVSDILYLSRSYLAGLPLLSRILPRREKEWHSALVPFGLFHVLSFLNYS